MPDATVHQYGTDTSGRPIYMTEYMQAWWQGICRELGFTPTIVQGAWMTKVPGGGADASGGYHDGGGCLDLRVWDRTATQREAMIHAIRWGGAGGYIRDQAHGGMDEHLHLVLGSDYGLAPGAAWQWLNYLSGGNGLTGASAGPDYHPRPRPVVEVPPASLFGDWIDMATQDELKKLLRDEVTGPLRERMNEIARGDKERLKAQTAQIAAALDELAGSVADDATKRQVGHVKDLVKSIRDQIDTATEENA